MGAVDRPPGPGSSLAQRRREFFEQPAEFLLRLQREYGDIVHFRVGLRHHYLISHPDHIKDVLVTHHRRFHKDPTTSDVGLFVGENLITSEGETHRRHRKLIQPAFDIQRVKRYRAIAVDEARALADSFQESEVRDIAEDMAGVALGVAVRALFGTDIDADTRTAVTAYARGVLEGWGVRTGIRKASMASDDYRATLEIGEAIVDRLIREVRSGAGDRDDLLSALLAAVDEEGRSFTDQEARDEVAALIIAGHETTANALAWTWYHLAQNPHAESKMIEEIRDAGLRAESWDADVPLPYVEQVFAESLRLCPIVWNIPRLAVEDHEIGGYQIPAGAIVMMSPYIVQRDPRWYPDPEQFDPDRWSPEAPHSPPRYAYFPFGGGVRMCIGQPFALMEATPILALIASRWRLRLEPGHPVEAEFGIALRAKRGIRVICEPRG